MNYFILKTDKMNSITIYTNQEILRSFDGDNTYSRLNAYVKQNFSVGVSCKVSFTFSECDPFIQVQFTILDNFINEIDDIKKKITDDLHYKNAKSRVESKIINHEVSAIDIEYMTLIQDDIV